MLVANNNSNIYVRRNCADARKRDKVKKIVKEMNRFFTYIYPVNSFTKCNKHTKLKILLK